MMNSTKFDEKKLNISNELNKNLANSQKRDKEIFAENYVIMNEFHTHKAGPSKIMKSNRPNSYALEISHDLGISSTFIISNLVESREPAVMPSEPLEPLPFFMIEPTLE